MWRDNVNISLFYHNICNCLEELLLGRVNVQDCINQMHFRKMSIFWYSSSKIDARARSMLGKLMFVYSLISIICALDTRKYATHLRKFWRQFPSSSYKKWTLTWIGWLLHHFHRKFACPWNFFKMYSFLLHCVSQTRSSWVAALGNWIITSTIQ